MIIWAWNNWPTSSSWYHKITDIFAQFDRQFDTYTMVNNVLHDSLRDKKKKSSLRDKNIFLTHIISKMLLLIWRKLKKKLWLQILFC